MNVQFSDKPLKILILGGGTAGWMSAALLSKQWAGMGHEVALLESDAIGTIGVGEGTTPSIKTFFDTLEIPESEWMQACNATFKTGIRFTGWSNKSGYSSYFHPFFSQLDQFHEQAFRHNSRLRAKGFDVTAHPDVFFSTALLAEQDKAPLSPGHFPFGMHYAYHFDAGLLANFLRSKAKDWGTTHHIGTLDSVSKHSDGSIASVRTIEGDHYTADVFIDCSGFRSLLLGQALEVPYISFANSLLNDAAVTLATEMTPNIPSLTTSTALKAGWAWRIPLTSRFGNGYVYSSRHISEQEAEQELRLHLGIAPHEGKANHLKMRVGRFAKGWEKNCVALGLSQGFIEPLEATALHFVSQSLLDFVEAFTVGKATDSHQHAYNQQLASRYDGIKDYIELHYLSNSRADTQYWQDCRAFAPSKSLQAIMDTWWRGDDLIETLASLQATSLYTPLSWYCMLSGVGTYPSVSRQQHALPESAQVDIDAIKRFNQQCAAYFPAHAQSVTQNP